MIYESPYNEYLPSTLSSIKPKPHNVYLVVCATSDNGISVSDHFYSVTINLTGSYSPCTNPPVNDLVNSFLY